MKEQLFTIPVNMAFDAMSGCPVCGIYRKLEQNEISAILGAAMMDREVREMTNEQGFCDKHVNVLYNGGSRLSMALMLETHLMEIKKELYEKRAGGKHYPRLRSEYLEKLDRSCYLCSRISRYMGGMLYTVFYLWKREEEFRAKLRRQECICLRHYHMLTDRAQSELSKADLPRFMEDLDTLMRRHLDTLIEDVSWFCQKFDYQNEDADWKNSKDAVERAAAFLASSVFPDQRSGK